MLHTIPKLHAASAGAALLVLVGCEQAGQTGTAPAPEAPAEFVSGDFTTDTHSFTEVADGVYFARYTVPMFNSNAMVLINDEDVLVVDSHITPATAQTLIDSIRKVTDKPITTIVNTHFHYDHAHGTQAFGPVQVVGHEHTRMRMTGDPMNEGTFQSELMRQPQALASLEGMLAEVEAEDEETRGRLEAQIALQKAHMEATKEIVPVPPDTTFKERISLFRGDREIQVHFFGRAHTGGDAVIYLPADKIAFTGDMMLGGPSWLGDGHVDEWPDTLEGLKGLDIETILPGHGGPVTNLDLIDYVQAYYRDLWAQVVSMRAEGKDPGEVAAAVDLTGHAETLNITRAGADPQAVLRIYQLLDERGA